MSQNNTTMVVYQRLFSQIWAEIDLDFRCELIFQIQKMNVINTS